MRDQSYFPEETQMSTESGFEVQSAGGKVYTKEEEKENRVLSSTLS